MDLKKISLLSRIAGGIVGGILGMLIGPISMPIISIIKLFNPNYCNDSEEWGAIFLLYLEGTLTLFIVPLGLCMIGGLLYGLARGIELGITGGFMAGLAVPKELFTVGDKKKIKKEIDELYDKAYILLNKIRCCLAKETWVLNLDQLQIDFESLIFSASKVEKFGYVFENEFKNEAVLLLGKSYSKTNQQEAAKQLNQIPSNSKFYPESQSLLNLMQGRKILEAKLPDESIIQKLTRLSSAEQYLIKSNSFSDEAHGLLLNIQCETGYTKHKISQEKNYQTFEKPKVQDITVDIAKNRNSFFSSNVNEQPPLLEENLQLNGMLQAN